MVLEILPLTGLALVLGFKHSYDADHLIAVGNFLRNAQDMKNAVWMGVSWAIGHMVTASILTFLLYSFREVFVKLFSHFEIIASLMLIVMGMWTLKDIFRLHKHSHKHDGKWHEHYHIHRDDKHVHSHMLGIGIVHGLASNDELLILLTTELGIVSLGGMIFGTMVFSLGVVLGMVIFSAIFTYPIIKVHSEGLFIIVTAIIGVASLIYGVLGLGIH